MIRGTTATESKYGRRTDRASRESGPVRFRFVEGGVGLRDWFFAKVVSTVPLGLSPISHRRQ